MLIRNYFKPTQYYKKEVKEEAEENFVPYTPANVWDNKPCLQVKRMER